MSTRNTNSLKVFVGQRRKDNKHTAQMSRVYSALFKEPKTMLMVAEETGILRANICRYIAKWQKNKCIDVVKVGRCEITKYEANYYTTNPHLFSKSNQLKMF